MDCVPLGVDFIDRDMDMEIVSVVMHGTDPLMFSEANSRTHAVFNIAKNFGRWLFARSEGNQQVIGLVAFGALVALLNSQRLSYSPFQRFVLKVSEANLTNTLLLLLGIGDVFHQVPEAAKARFVHWHFPGNHENTRAILAAKKFISGAPSQAWLLGCLPDVSITREPCPASRRYRQRPISCRQSATT